MPDINTSTARQKLINVILFFASNTKFCGKIKLFKLLYLLDFEHFSQTGKSVTGYEYEAWKFGPVPTDLMEEWEELGSDLAQAIDIKVEKVIDYDRLKVIVKEGIEFNDQFFTPRELRLMSVIAEKYHDTTSGKLIDITHEQNGAWDKVWQQGMGDRNTIPYELALNEADINREILIDIGAQESMYQAALKAARQSAQLASVDY